MPIVKVGDKRIKFPDDMSREEIRAALAQQFGQPQASPEAPGGLETLGAGFRRGLEQVTGGLGQRAFEGLLAFNESRLSDLAEKINSGELPATEENIQKFDQLSSMVQEGRAVLAGAQEREIERRGEFAPFEEQRPILSTVGQVGGQLAGGTMVAPGVGSVLPTTLRGRIAAGAATGAAFGGLQPTIEDESVGENVAAGAVFGAVAPPVVEKAVMPVVKGTAGLIASKLFGKPTAKQKELMERLAANPRDPDLARFEVVSGKPSKTARLKDAVKQFGDPAPIAVIKASGQQDKAAYKKMVEIIQKGKKDPLFSDRFRVGDVVGDSLRNRVVATKKLLETSGKQIDNIVKTKLKGKTVDVSSAKAQFKEALDNLRVGYDPDTGGVTFSGSALEGAGGTAARDLVKRMALRLKDDVISAEDAHFAKRLIDQKTAFGTKDSGLSGEIDRAIKGLRSSINQSLRDAFPDYAKANQKYSDSINAIDAIQDAAGSKLDLDSVEALGKKARSFTSNNDSRARLLDALDTLQGNLEKYGVTFKDDILAQANIANALEARFKTQGATTLQSEVGKAVEGVVDKGVTRLAIEKAAKAAGETVGGVSDEKALESLLKILSD